MAILDSRIYLALWLLVYAIVVILAHRRRKYTKLTAEQIILTAGFSLAGVFALFKVLANVFIHYDFLKEKLDWDGLTAITISCVLGSFIALKEVRKLF
jgi:hypothetical protein